MALLFALAFALAWLGAYRPAAVGAAGWAAAAGSFVAWRRARRANGPAGAEGDSGRGDLWLAAALLALAAALYLPWASESLLTGRDQGLYASHGMHIAETGGLRLEPPMPEIMSGSFRYLLEPTNPRGYTFDISAGDIYMQFPPTFALFLAQAYGVAGADGVFGFNPLLAAVNAAGFFALCRMWLGPRLALAAALLFAFNAAQLYLARITLSEALAQTYFLAGLSLYAVAARSARPALFPLAAALIGFAAFIRVDAFLAGPLLLAGLVLDDATDADPARDARRWRGVAAGAYLLVAGLAFGYSAATSASYFSDFTTHILWMGAASLAPLAAWVALVRWPEVRRRTADWLRADIAWKGSLALLCALFLYGLFVRPHLGPFHEFEDAHYGARTYRENTLQFIGAYVSYPAALLAVIGAGWALRREKAGSERSLLPYALIALFLGFALFYLYDPRISADHPWRMRRYVPAVLPGIALFAAVGAGTLTGRLGSREGPRQTLELALVCLTALFVAVAAKPVLFLKQHEGAAAFVHRIAESIPEDSLVLAEHLRRVMGPLHLAAQKRVVAAYPDNPIQMEQLAALHAVAREQGRETWLMTRFPPFWENPSSVRQIRWTDRRLRRSARAPATEIVEVDYRVALTPLEGPSLFRQPLERSFVAIGGLQQFGVADSGFHGQEWRGDTPFRWTGPQASLELPNPRSSVPPRRIVARIASAKPGGAATTLRLNGRALFEGLVPQQGKTVAAALPHEAPADRLRLEIEAEGWRPSEVFPEATDSRMLGLQIESVEFHWSEAIAYAQVRFGARPTPGIEESGLWPGEENEQGPFRWTNGRAVFQLRRLRPETPQRVAIALGDGPKAPSPIEIRSNGAAAWKGAVERYPAAIEFDLPPTPESPVLELEIRSQTFVPGGGDERELGVRIQSIELR